MRRTLPAVAAILILFGILRTDFTPEPRPDPVYDPYQAIWAPRIFTDCETWTIRQSDAGLEDVWPLADYMTINGEGEYDTGEIHMPRTTDVLDFAWVRKGQVIYTWQVIVEDACSIAEAGVDA